MTSKSVCVLGGTGFVGHEICARLSREGWSCLVPSRHPERHRDLLIVPGVRLVQIERLDAGTLESLLTGCRSVINLVGILNESSASGCFAEVHIQLVDHIVEAARKTGVKRYLHMSALNADTLNGRSEYLRSKGEGENHAHIQGGSAMKITSFRPSVIFGPRDSFFNRFAALLRLAPGFFPLACPETRFAPVYVGDVADAFVQALDRPEAAGRHYELCGPTVYTLAELVHYTAACLGRHCLIWKLGDWSSRLQAQILERLPGKPMTYDNYLSLQIDSICKESGLEQFGIRPHSVEAIVPLYLGVQGTQGRMQRLRMRF